MKCLVWIVIYLSYGINCNMCNVMLWIVWPTLNYRREQQYNTSYTQYLWVRYIILYNHDIFKGNLIWYIHTYWCQNIFLSS